MTLQRRLNACAQKGALSTADLAVWFGIPYQTVRSYRERERTPNVSRRAAIARRLLLLELALWRDIALPIPLTVRNYERRKHLLGVLHRVQRRQ